MVLLIIIFEVVVAFKIALGCARRALMPTLSIPCRQLSHHLAATRHPLSTCVLTVTSAIWLHSGFTPLGVEAKIQEIVLDFVLFAAISLLCQSLFITSTHLLMPWQSAHSMSGRTAPRPSYEEMGGAARTAEYFAKALLRKANKLTVQPEIASIDLPAEYFILLPLNGHRRLFGEFGHPDAEPEQRSSSIFLKAFHPLDAALMEQFVQTDSWKMMKILHQGFRDLAPTPRALVGDAGPTSKHGLLAAAQADEATYVPPRAGK